MQIGTSDFGRGPWPPAPPLYTGLEAANSEYLYKSAAEISPSTKFPPRDFPHLRRFSQDMCREPGFYGLLGVSLIRQHYPNARVQHIPVRGIADIQTLDNTSMGLLQSGAADIISYAVSASFQNSANVAYTQLLRGPSIAFVMKDFDASSPAVSANDLLQTPAGYWFQIASHSLLLHTHLPPGSYWSACLRSSSCRRTCW